MLTSLRVITEAPRAWSFLNGLITIYKPSGLSTHRVQSTIIANICRGWTEILYNIFLEITLEFFEKHFTQCIRHSFSTLFLSLSIIRHWWNSRFECYESKATKAATNRVRRWHRRKIAGAHKRDWPCRSCFGRGRSLSAEGLSFDASNSTWQLHQRSIT